MKDLKRTNMERSPGADPTVTMLLRAAYAPPDKEFWVGLEQRIRARLQEVPSASWWSVLSEWRNARYQEVRLRIKSPLDSVRDSSRVLINQQLDSSQQHRFKALINSMVARDSVRRARGDIR